MTATYAPLLAGQYLVEQKVSGLSVADYSIDGKIDLVGRSPDGVDVFDWKSGEDDDSSDDCLQLLMYSWWSGQKYGVPPEHVRARKVFLAAPAVGRTVQVNDAVIRRAKARIVQDVQLMQYLDGFGREGNEEAFTPCERPNVCRQCKYRGTCSAGMSVTKSRPTSTSLPVLLTAG